MCLPAIEALVAPETEIWAPAANLRLFAHLGRTRSLSSTGLDLFELPGIDPSPGLIDRLRSFDDIVSWYGSNRPAVRERAAELCLPFRFFETLPPAGTGVHAVDFYLSQFELCSGALPRLPFLAEREGHAVIHPFSGSPKKNWPLDKFREVADLLSTRMPVRWCSGPAEELADATRFDDLGDLARWLARASLYIGNDSGITHLAAAVGVPVVAIFGPTDPRIWAPRGPYVAVLSHESCADDVARSALALLAEADSAQNHP